MRKARGSREGAGQKKDARVAKPSRAKKQRRASAPETRACARFAGRDEVSSSASAPRAPPTSP